MRGRNATHCDRCSVASRTGSPIPPDEPASYRFYDAILSTIDWSSHAQYPGWRGYSKGGRDEGFVLWVCRPQDGAPATAGNGTMIGFPAASHAEVDAFHAAGLANGGRCEGEPGPRPPYGPTWYSAYLRDPCGNKIAIVYNG